jgi:hypothetical protein
MEAGGAMGTGRSYPMATKRFHGIGCRDAARRLFFRTLLLDSARTNAGSPDTRWSTPRKTLMCPIDK